MTPLVILAVALAIVIGGVLVLRLHPFVVLLAAAFAAASLVPADPGQPASPGELVAHGFGKTILDVGIVIALASILGSCLAAVGGARVIVEAIQRCLGERNTPVALLAAGFVLGVPMFAETVFYLLLPLARAAWERTGRGYLLSVLAIVAGATMTHSLVPPTPGPLFVADALGVGMATMIGVGLGVGSIAALAGYAYACWADARWPLEPVSRTVAASTSAAFDGGRLPPLWAALLPIGLPIALISLESGSRAAPGWLPASCESTVRIVGEKNAALGLAAIAAMAVLLATRRSLPQLRTTLAEAVTEAGSIMLVIGAGGALGATLRHAGLATISKGLAAGDGIALVATAWVVTALIRIAQGSATEAMITAAGIFAPLMTAGDATAAPVLVAVAIGCGSKVGMWMNDSGFWVVARMSGMSETQTLRTVSTMVAVEGAVGLAVTLAIASAWPAR